MAPVRRIMHVDMDAFYASVEQADNHELKGKPVIVGGAKRGVVSAASYEARKFGVRSAMPVFQARRLCPHGVYLSGRMDRYREVSRQVMGVLARVSPLMEMVSIDEAYIDITGTEGIHGPERILAGKIKTAILDETSLTCSIGIAPNKFLAKIASDMNKPDGLTVIEEDGIVNFLRVLPVRKIPGIGEKTHLTLKELGISVAADILSYPVSFWTKHFGTVGLRLYEKARGIDNSAVVPFSEPKSCSAEDTFPQDTGSVAELERWIMIQAEEVGRELRHDGYRGKTVTLKVKFSDFRVTTKSVTLSEPTNCTQVIYETAVKLLRETKLSEKVRLTGVGVTNLSGGLKQAALFPDNRVVKHEKLDQALDRIHDKFGKKSIRRGHLF